MNEQFQRKMTKFEELKNKTKKDLEKKEMLLSSDDDDEIIENELTEEDNEIEYEVFYD